MARSRILALILLLHGAFAEGPLPAQQTDPALRDDALRALKKAATFYRGKVASHGGYVYYYSVDLDGGGARGKRPPTRSSCSRRGRRPSAWPTSRPTPRRATASTSMPPAKRPRPWSTASWSPAAGRRPSTSGRPKRLGKYRNGKGGSWNVSSLDDGQTQAALQMLVRADQALDFKHAGIHEAALYGLDALLKAQFPNGAFPQVWTGPVEPKPVVKARFPDYDWKTEGKIKNYWDYYTLNDGLAGTVADTLIAAHQVYKDDEVQGRAREARRLPDPGADARPAARLVPAVQLTRWSRSGPGSSSRRPSPAGSRRT